MDMSRGYILQPPGEINILLLSILSKNYSIVRWNRWIFPSEDNNACFWIEDKNTVCHIKLASIVKFGKYKYNLGH